jgi:hypothetical protein
MGECCCLGVRLRQIEDVLGTELEPAESRLSLHVALLALQAAATPVIGRAIHPPDGGA